MSVAQSKSPCYMLWYQHIKKHFKTNHKILDDKHKHHGNKYIKKTKIRDP
jgi:hypothetical protein